MYNYEYKEEKSFVATKVTNCNHKTKSINFTFLLWIIKNKQQYLFLNSFIYIYITSCLKTFFFRELNDKLINPLAAYKGETIYISFDGSSISVSLLKFQITYTMCSFIGHLYSRFFYLLKLTA